MLRSDYIGLSYGEAEVKASLEGVVLRKITVGSSPRQKKKRRVAGDSEVVYVELSSSGLIVAVH